MTLSDIASFLAVVISIAGLVMAARKAPHEEGNLDADTAKTYEEAAALSAERANRLEKQLDTVNKTVKDLQQQNREQQLLLDELAGRDAVKGKRLDALEVENKELKERLKIVEDENLDLKDWINDLVGVLDKNKIPVPPKPEREKTKPR